MQVIAWDDFVDHGLLCDKECSLTIGVFDGIHIGHQRLIKNVVNASEGAGRLCPIVVTFKNNPSEFLHPGNFLGNISTLKQKLSWFGIMGIEHIVLIDFSAEFSKLTGSDFLRRVTEHLRLRYVCLGKNFHCGRDNDTNSLRVKSILEDQYGKIRVDIVEQVSYADKPVSSTRIRREILAGNIPSANEMLGKKYEWDLSEREGTIGSINQIVPPDGIYEVSTEKEESGKIEIKNGILINSFRENILSTENTIRFINKIVRGDTNGIG